MPSGDAPLNQRTRLAASLRSPGLQVDGVDVLEALAVEIAEQLVFAIVHADRPAIARA